MSRGQKYTFDEGGVTFYYFLAAIIAFYVIPKTIQWTKSQFKHTAGSSTAMEKCACDLCKEKERRSASLSSSKSVTATNYPLVIGWLLLAVVLGAAIRNTKEDAKMFDPFEILSIPSSASDQLIRKAYKKLSLRFHPDKAKPGERALHERRFLEISKAYRALTDEVARKNWEEYGNPDGPKQFSLGIALPSWLVDSKYSILVILAYIAAFGIGVPLLVRSIWNHSKEYTRDNILHSTMQLFYQDLKDAMSVRKLIDIICQADEFKEIAMNGVAVESLVRRLNEHCDEPYEPSKKIASSPSASSTHALIYAHLNRMSLEPAERIVLDKVLVRTIRLITGLIQISVARKWSAAAMNCMTLHAMLIQALPENGSSLLQLPYLKPEILKHCQTKRRQVKSIKDVLDMDAEERSSLFRDLSEVQIKTLIQVAHSLPVLFVRSVEFKILGQSTIIPGGLVTCMARLELSSFGRLKSKTESSPSSEEPSPTISEEEPIAFEFDEDGNMLEGGKVRFGVQEEVMDRLAPVHTPYFPVDKRPGWWVILFTRNMSHAISQPVRVTDLIDKKTVSFQFAAPPRPGKYPFSLVVRSDCMFGVDVQRDVDLIVSPAPSANDHSQSSASSASSASESESEGGR